jgi:predicted 3-demethylubiquinone-9 3-methyltransferase (glyoxalase superfamily)
MSLQAPKITPFLWFDNQAEEAANFYTSIFKNSRILTVNRFTEGGPGQKGRVQTIVFELEGLRFTALNGGPQFKFNEAISFVVHCDTQEELDGFWNRLTEGGREVQCGWLKDRFGLSWQIVPKVLFQLFDHPDPAKRSRVMQAMFKMKKLDIAGLENA